MVENLAADGYPITWEQVSGLAAGGSVGRPHIGRALVESGVVPDVDAAFRDLLSSRQPYYVRKPDTDVFEAIGLIRAAGGLPVFAHPHRAAPGPGRVRRDGRGDGRRRAWSGSRSTTPTTTPTTARTPPRWPPTSACIGTGSSDYHGTNKPTPIGARLTDPAALRAAAGAAGRAPPVGGRADVAA